MSASAKETTLYDRQATVDSLARWFSRRRIALSLLLFTGFVCFNVLIVRPIPLNPLSFDNALSVLALSLIATGLLIRSWSAGTLNKSREVTAIGPYAVVRNPLYIGSFLMMVGFCVLTKDLPTFLLVAGPMSFLYWIQVRHEEVRLLKLFPTQWSSYADSVPRFIPRRIGANAFKGWSAQYWLLNREYQALFATAIGLACIAVWHYMVRS